MTDKVQKIKEFLIGMAGAACCDAKTKKNIETIILPFVDSLQEKPVKIKKGCKYRCLSDMQNTDTGAISFFKDKIYYAPEDDTLVSEEYGWLCDTSENSSNFELVEEPLSDDYENALNSVAVTFLQEQQIVPNFYADIIMKAVKHGANWQKQKDEKENQMLKNAVDGEILEVEDDPHAMCISTHLEVFIEDDLKKLGLKNEDKVKVIIIKED